MKILHICTSGEYTEGFSYQDNLITKFMVKQGWDVYIIASPLAYDENGKTIALETPQSYVNADGVKVTRLPFRKPTKICRKLRRMKGFYAEMEKIAPDIIYIHNPQTTDSGVVIKYLKRHKNVKLYADNHGDFSNSATNWLSKNILHKILWKHYFRRLNKYAEVFYGVLPARVEFLKNVYGLPADRCKLLVMGGDDDLVEAAAKPEVKRALREEYGLGQDDFVIMTGGKIDPWKTQTLLLMEAVRQIEDPRVKLVVFGSVSDDLMDKVRALADGTKIQYIGWVQANDSYRYFAAADLVVFPGRHSVFWGQVAAQGIPMIVKEWDGTNDIDLGGNVRFLTQDSVEEIRGEIERLLTDPAAYAEMKRVAVEKGIKTFSYADIARRAIQ